MAIIVDPSTFVITVPEADLSLVQSVPSVIYNMDINWFRLQLKDWEDGGDGLNGGITFLKTHTHNTEVTLGGLTYARVVELLDPYTITFENGAYAVNLVGANSNIADKVNVNNVSVRSQNSAGLISTPLIEHSSFNGGISIDIINGVIGTLFPIGTQLVPVSNTDDALLIDSLRGFGQFFIIGDCELNSGTDFEERIFIGESQTKSVINIDTNADVTNCEFYDAEVTGTLDGGNVLKDCLVRDINYVNGYIERCILGAGTITLGGSADAHFLDCWSGVIGTSTPIIDMGGAGQSLALRNYAGGIKLINKTGTEEVSLDLISGQIILDSTVTNGTIVARGVGKLIDTSGNRISSGTWNGVTILNELMSKGTISEAVWDEPIVDHITADTTGHEMLVRAYGNVVHYHEGAGSGTSYPWGTHGSPVGNLGDALTIANLYNIHNIHVDDNVSINGEDITGFTFIADRSLGNSITIVSMVNTGTCYFQDLTVSGALSGATRFTTCVLGALTGFDGGAKNCLITDAITVTGTGANYFTNCDTYVTDSTAYKNIDIDGYTLNIIRCRGNYEIDNKTSVNTTSIDLVGGRVHLTSGCIAGSVEVNGIAEVVDDSGVGCTVFVNSMSHVAISENVWDEPLTGTTHNEPTSAGRKLRQVTTGVIREGLAQGSGIGSNQIQLDSLASSIDGTYDPAIISISDGTGIGQSRLILEYDGATRIATVDRNWKVLPSTDSNFIITTFAGREHVNEGLARGGEVNSITLNALAASQDDTYIGQVVFIRSGIGEDQACRVIAYNGTTKVATIAKNWAITPDTTSAYVMLPTSVLDVNNLITSIVDFIWDEDITTHTAADSAGKLVQDTKRDVGDAQGLILAK